MHARTFSGFAWVGVVALGVIGFFWFAARARHELATANQALAKAERRVAAAEVRAGNAETAALSQKPDQMPASAVRSDGTTPTPMFVAPPAWKEERRSPEFLHIQAEETRAGLFKNYAAVFRKLQLSPEDFRRLQALMIERNLVGFEVANLQAEAGEVPMTTAQMLKLITDQKAVIDEDTARFLGPEKWETFQNYHRTLDLRREVNDIAQRLGIAQTPLTEAQVDKLTDSLAAVQTKLRAAHQKSLPSSIPLEARRAADAELFAVIICAPRTFVAWGMKLSNEMSTVTSTAYQ